MGLSYSCFIGPYIQVHNPPRAGNEKVQTCPKKGCDHYGKKLWSQFCPTCGSPAGEVLFPTLRPLYIDHVELFGDESMAPVMTEYKPDGWTEYDFYVGNKKGMPGLHLDASATVLTLDANRIVEETSKFQSVCERQIEKLQEVFGRNAVQVKWGMLGYTS